MVSNRVVGFAQAITAGFGNFGGGCANSVMPLLLYHFDLSWRVYITILSVILIILAIIYYFGTDDVFQPDNNNLNVKDNNNISSPNQSTTNDNDQAILLQHEESGSISSNNHPHNSNRKFSSSDIDTITAPTHIRGSFVETICDYRVW
eukprot:CAMPEP_0201568782 /NCGR_PEP_ID=MMETSP0190_2-20130828/10019_1 /ASSEMBLY_ACC=CAM_ASM_000263 /TAXON_ID=37353 /ORGANISM="Rosalina sp." /LENGTH=147 /DNA_ID=CAMNT_0047990293 /DNA_START=410 /DNA_END=850 /DNA_ORIENTATION=-